MTYFDRICLVAVYGFYVISHVTELRERAKTDAAILDALTEVVKSQRIVMREVEQIRAQVGAIAQLQSWILTSRAGQCHEDIERMIVEAATTWGRPVGLVRSLARVESTFNPLARSTKDARGLLQVKPETLEALHPGADPAWLYDPEFNLHVGLEELQRLQDRSGGDLAMALRSYNFGESRVRDGITDSTFEKAVLGTK